MERQLYAKCPRCKHIQCDIETEEFSNNKEDFGSRTQCKSCGIKYPTTVVKGRTCFTNLYHSRNDKPCWTVTEEISAAIMTGHIAAQHGYLV